MMGDPQGDNQMLILGEIKGQLRELVHNINTVIQQQTALGMRIAKLEEDKIRRDGAAGLIALVVKSPAIGWLVGAAVSAWAILTGKVHV